jgi:hypothetical protein
VDDAKAALWLDALFRRDGDPVLQVVTCGGEYVREPWAVYQDNIVVTARPYVRRECSTADPAGATTVPDVKRSGTRGPAVPR